MRKAQLPDNLEMLLLQAGLLPSGEALRAWKEFSAQIEDIEALDDTDYALFPLVAANLEKVGEEVPHRHYLQSALKHAWSRSQGILAGALPFLKRLRERNIEFLVCGAIALAATYYRKDGSRPMTDAGILIHPHDLEAVTGILVEMEYAPQDPVRGKGEELARWGFRRTFIHREGIPFHLHWHLLKGDRQPEVEKRFWSSAVSCDLADFKGRTPGPADQFLHACTEWMDLTTVNPRTALIDTVLIRCRGIDWTYLEKQSCALRQTAAVAEILRLHDRLGLVDREAPAPLENWRQLPVTGMERLELACHQKGPQRRAGIKQGALTYLRLHRGAGLFSLIRDFTAYARQLNIRKGMTRRLALLGYVLVWSRRVNFFA